jgi:hypothetical protein
VQRFAVSAVDVEKHPGHARGALSDGAQAAGDKTFALLTLDQCSKDKASWSGDLEINQRLGNVLSEG